MSPRYGIGAVEIPGPRVAWVSLPHRLVEGHSDDGDALLTYVESCLRAACPWADEVSVGLSTASVIEAGGVDARDVAEWVEECSG